MKIVLTGCRCSGKTHVGRVLAHRLGVPLSDTDDLIEKRAGKSVADIFAHDGEESFRKIERDVISGLRDISEGVIAAGGGGIIDETNAAALKQNAKVIWLETSPGELTRRARAEEKNSVTRPPLTDLPLEEEIAKVAAERRGRYTATADCIINTDRYTVDEVADKIIDYLELIGIIKPPNNSKK